MDDIKLGPSGGEGGIPVVDYAIPAGARIREVHVTSGWFVDSIRIVYADETGATRSLPGVGGHGSHEHQFALEADEYLIGVSGRSGKYVDSIVFHTNRRVSPSYGGHGGENSYTFLAPEGSEVAGFFGRADWYIDAIGIIARALPAAISVESAAEPELIVKTPKTAKAKKAEAPPTAEPAPAVAQKPQAAAKSKKTKEAAPAAAESKIATKSAPAVEVAATPASDNLQIIEGIGPKIAELLAQNGITSFAALASTPASELREMLLAAGRRFAVSDPTSWPEQASLAAKDDQEALKALQSSLKGGRKPQ